MAALLAFWISGAALAYTFAGYGALMALLARGRRVKSAAPALTKQLTIRVSVF